MIDEVKRLTNELAGILKVMEMHGLEIIKEENKNIPGTYRLSIYPVFHCAVCDRLSAPRMGCEFYEQHEEGVA